ncbi:alkaline phosphatase [Imhoffiella purpurea]|uniref:Alkaline phosphatase n=1 Tax=Imhoffiella purpurea TaxID=1249627 RepID=W9VFH8_9GAMM|nr:alkaline phosphatase [Imhoffiella purpurea]EXJ15766.1 Alkaline phosphatase [Imhoffiella purpurea]
MYPNSISRLLLATAALCFAGLANAASSAKYVFFFLGDGMASAQIQATEAYLTTRNGGSATKAIDLLNADNRLNMTQLPVLGMQTTYDAGALMTDSASAGTAFATGIKTKSGVIGMDETLTTSYKSIAQIAHEHGRNIGIISSVSLDHATPASYYASVTSRGYMNQVATQLAESGYDFFGGGGLVAPTGAARSGDTANNVWDLLTANGYTVLNDRASILDLKGAGAPEMVVAINETLDGSSAMPYSIDRPETNLSLAEMTEVAIEYLYEKNNRGFFLMVEGGKIDWACHANDAVAAIGDVLDFDQAIAKALTFYEAHPKDTLIVVTGDHETGGMTIGHATTAYTAYYDKLFGQENSFEYFAANQWEAHKAKYEEGYDWTQEDNLASNSEMVGLLESAFGLVWNDLNDYQKQKLEDAYDMSMTDENDNSKAENTLLYGSYEPIIVTITHILNEVASIGWTSYSHTGVPVPVFAQGGQADLFAGFYDNTDIAKNLSKAMGFRETLPVAK